MEISKRATGLVAAVGAAIVLYGGGKVADYAKHFFSSEPDKNADIRLEKHYTASGKIVNVTKTEGAYLLEAEIAGTEGTEQEALSALGCVSSCKRTLYVNAKSINEEYKTDLEKIARADLKVWDGMLALQGIFYVTETQQGQAYMAAVQSVAVDVTEKRLLSNHAITGTSSSSSSSNGNEPGLFDKLKPYLPYIMKYIDLQDVVKVNRIIENVKDGTLDGLEALSERINWKKYQADKQAGKIDDMLEKLLQRVSYAPPNTLDDAVESEVKTEEILGTLVGGKQYGDNIKLKVSIEDHPELRHDKKGVVTLEVNQHTSFTPKNHALLQSFLGRYNQDGCRTSRCGEYTFSATILPAELPGNKYTLNDIKISNSGMKPIDDDMDGKLPSKQREQPSAMRIPLVKGDLTAEVKDESEDKSQSDSDDNDDQQGPLRRGFSKASNVVPVMERGLEKLSKLW